MTVSYPAIATGFFTGVAAGLLYFGGLWLTVAAVTRSRRPHLLLVGSLAARILPLLLVFFLLVRWDWMAAVAAMAGFLLARRFWLSAKGGKERCS